MRTRNREEVIRALQGRLFSYPGALAWYLLGSAARDQLRPDSDVDLAVLPRPETKVDPEELLRFGASLMSHLGRTVDVGLVSSSNLVYAKEALLNGILLSDAQPELTTLVKANLLALYLRFQEDRKEVLDAYRAR